MTKHQLPITVLGPFQSYFRKKKPNFNIIIKIPLTTGSLLEKEKTAIFLKQLLISVDAFKIAKQIIVDPATLN